jgi:hypothetical protein
LHVICPGSVCSELDEGITATGLAATTLKPGSVPSWQHASRNTLT